jgi:CrcB protein
MSGLALESNTFLEQSHYGAFAINLLANVGLSIAALIGGKSLMSAIINN